MKSLLLLAAGCYLLSSCNTKPSEPTTAGTKDTMSESKAKPQSEFADTRFVEIGKRQLAQFFSGDIDGWLSGYTDNAKYYWSSGDSLIGKSAIANYWKNRRAKYIDSIQFSNDIWLPLKVNRPQRGPDIPGIWLLTWHDVNVKYKNGKKLNFWVHSLFHFDSTDKVDLSFHYVDRGPINKALGL